MSRRVAWGGITRKRARLAISAGLWPGLRGRLPLLGISRAEVEARTSRSGELRCKKTTRDRAGRGAHPEMSRDSRFFTVQALTRVAPCLWVKARCARRSLARQAAAAFALTTGSCDKRATIVALLAGHLSTALAWLTLLSIRPHHACLSESCMPADIPGHTRHVAGVLAPRRPRGHAWCD